MTEAQPELSKAKKRTYKQNWLDEVEFALAECVRYQGLLVDAVATKQLSALPKNDLLYEMRGAARKFICGREASVRLADAANDALQRSDVARTVSLEPLFKAIQERIIERFIVKGEDVSLSKVDSAFTSALNEVRKLRADSRTSSRVNSCSWRIRIAFQSDR